MSSLNKNKCLSVLVLATMLLAGCSTEKGNNIISSELISEESGFGQEKAESGDFEETKTFDAERIYPISSVMTSSYNEVILKEINVKAGQAVKKGELLVTIAPITEADLANKEAAITKISEEDNQVLANYQTTMEELRQNIASSTDTQQKLYQTQLEKIQRQYDWYEKDAKQNQEEMRKNLEQLRSMPEDLNIYAPYDGVIDSVSTLTGGVELTTDKELIKMHSEEQIMLEVSKGSQLRYGQEVTVETGSGEKIKTYKGTVISADNIRGDSLKDGNVTIRIEEQVPAEELGNVRVKAKIKELHNVLVVKNYALNTEKDKSYISILEGDKIMKRRVITGGSCGGYTWILQGLNAGQSVTVQ